MQKRKFEGETPEEPKQKKQKQENNYISCPYLDTINRKLLDFDFEKICSETLSNINVYCCLVCGKYFQGRGTTTAAYFHSLHADHHVFMNLHNGKTYCLPDGYEVIESSLEDIKYNLNPVYMSEQIVEFDKVCKHSLALNGAKYIPGFVGLNNIKFTDPYNVIIQALSKISQFRNYFVKPENLKDAKSPVVQTFGELIRKIWNPKSFKDHVSPHEFLQAVSTASNKKFKIGEHADPAQFLMWLLNYIHAQFSPKRKNPSIITKIFQGKVNLTKKIVKVKVDHYGEEPEVVKPPTSSILPFLVLSLDIPDAPLFKDEMERNIIPQVPLSNVLSKFDGTTETNVPLGEGEDLEKRTYKLKKLPQCLILHFKRFSDTKFGKEKNPTIVQFPLKDLDLKDYTDLSGTNRKMSTKYDLVANIVHEGKADGGSWKVHVLNKANQKWYEIQDLDVHEILPQEIMISESYIQLYERKKQ